MRVLHEFLSTVFGTVSQESSVTNLDECTSDIETSFIAAGVTNLDEFTYDIETSFIAAGVTDMNSLISWATGPERRWILYPENLKLKGLLEENCNMRFSCPFRIRLVLELKTEVRERNSSKVERGNSSKRIKLTHSV
jgi:hypothetical protein